MAYRFQDGIMGVSPVGNIDAFRRLPLGQIGHAVDNLLGGADFVYLAGVAGTVVGSVVQYDQQAGTTTLAAATANLPGPLAVAMAAVGAGQYAWYQRSGLAVVSKTAPAITAGAIQLAAGGQVAGGAAAGLTVENARAQAAALNAPTVNVQLSYPSTTSI